MGKSFKNQLGEVVKKTESAGPLPVVILVGTQLGENIGGAARAMLNFGLTELRLVKPRDGWPSKPAVAMAAGAIEVIENAKLYETTAEAVADLNYLMAATARRREIEIPVIGTTDAGAQYRQWQKQGQKTGIMFGPEKAGLVNEDVGLADCILTYPINPAFQSLNLAQAVGVFAYIWASAETTAPPEFFQEEIAPPASRDDLVRMLDHFETELLEAGFFYPPEKMQIMKQNIRAPFVRARMTEQEVRTMRGMIKVLVKGRGRHLGQ
jgi:tRNA/rRNA methyltransferase